MASAYETPEFREYSTVCDCRKGARKTCRFETILISLDHDIDVVPDGQGGFRDPGTGRLVADFLVGQPAVCPVVIHSTNAAATVGMKMALEEAGWTTHIVAPYDDLAWIHEEWIYTVRKAILDTARTAEA